MCGEGQNKKGIPAPTRSLALTEARAELNAAGGEWESAVKAKQLIDGASYGPDALRAIGEAFDVAWAEIAGHFGSDPTEVEAARLKLAKAMLSIADEDSRDVDVLKQAALERMALDYRQRGSA